MEVDAEETAIVIAAVDVEGIVAAADVEASEAVVEKQIGKPFICFL